VEKISATRLAFLLKSDKPPILIDVRTPVDQQVSRTEGAISIPLEQLSNRLAELDKNKNIDVFYRPGALSTCASQVLTKPGFEQIKNLVEGINACADHAEKVFQY
jgi:rhodanese-related sulfurtransferase